MSSRAVNLLIKASAGTGKTFQLSNRYITLLADGVSPDRILATTFTRKAAGEILDRVLERLAVAAADGAKADQLAGYVRRPGLGPSGFAEMLGAVIGSLHRLRIGTLDSFFGQLARSHSFELGLPPSWGIVDDLVDERLRTEAIGDVLAEHNLADLLSLLNLLAKGEVRRSVSDLVRTTVNDLYQLYLETDATAWKSLPQPLPLKAERLEAAVTALESYSSEKKSIAKGSAADAQQARAGAWEDFLAKGIAAKVLAGETLYSRQTIPDDLIEIYQPLIAHAKAELVGLIVRQTEASFDLLDRFHGHYERLKNERRAMRFEDVTRRLAERPDLGGARLAFRLDAGIDHVLLDEFQDTSLPQWEVLRPIARRAASGTAGRSFFCVGDVKQAIYGWRGGVAKIFDALPDELDHLQSDDLDKSYRSAPPVIEAVNEIFAGIGRHKNLSKLDGPVHSWLQQFRPHQTARTELSGYVALEAAKEADEGEQQSDATFTYAAERVKQLTEAAPAATCGVLVRTNEAVAKMIYRLGRRRVAASEEGGNPLTDSAAVELILSLLKLADHPADTISRFHVMHSALGREVGLLDHEDDHQAAAVGAEARRRLVEEGYGPAVDDWARALAPDCSPRELNRLRQLVEMAYGYDEEATLRASDFVRHVEHTRVADPTTSRIRVMTIHQAKGLQFDIVVLPELDKQVAGNTEAFVVQRPSPTERATLVCRYANEATQQLLPPQVQQMFAEALDRRVAESLCNLYVALTRAARSLHMIVAPSSPTEKSLHKTYAGLLRAALTDGSPVPPETVLYKCGDADWHAGDMAVRETAEKAGDAVPVAVRLKPTAGRRRGLDVVTPSATEGGSRVTLDKVFGSAVAATRGTLMHRWFERVRWLDDGPPDVDQLRAATQELDTTGLNVEHLLLEFQEMLQQPWLREVLSRSYYQQVENLPLPGDVRAELQKTSSSATVRTEQPIAAVAGDALLQGEIDRLVLLEAGGRVMAADVLDFKTDGIERGDDGKLAERLDYYTPQLQAYRDAVATALRIPPQRIAARLVFLFAGQIKEVQPAEAS